jgi:hypothetical protein
VQVEKTSDSSKGVAATTMVLSGLVGLPATTLWGCFNTVQLITMQVYTGSEMPSNAANLFKSID